MVKCLCGVVKGSEDFPIAGLDVRCLRVRCRGHLVRPGRSCLWPGALGNQDPECCLVDELNVVQSL